MNGCNRRRFCQSLIGAASLAWVSSPVIRAQENLPARIGSKNFAEQYILSEIYGLLLNSAGVPTSMTPPFANDGAHQALIHGQIDLYPEYPGTALETVLKVPFADVKAQATAAALQAKTTPAATPIPGGVTQATPEPMEAMAAMIYERVAAFYAEHFDVTILSQSAFNDTQALAVTREFSETFGVTTISQLAVIAASLKISGPTDFANREDGLLGLQRLYGQGFHHIQVIADVDGDKYQQLIDGEVSVVLAFSTDGEIAAYDLIILEDDLELWPPYHCAPFVRREVLERYPAIVQVLNPIGPLLTNAVMSGLNARVTIDGEPPRDTALAFLRENQLIQV